MTTQHVRIKLEVEQEQVTMTEHAQDAAARFDHWARTYGDDRISPWFRFFQKFALSKLNIAEGCGFLDVGCGTGWAVREAANGLRNGKACGIDVSEKMVEKAIAQTQEFTNIEFRVADAEFIPYPDESFSSVLCTCSFHHYQNPGRALLEMKRVIKKYGKLVFIDSARDVSFAIWLQDLWRRHFERSHVRYYTTKELKVLVEQAGLKIVDEVVTIRRFMFHRKVFTGLVLLKCVK